MKSKWMLKCKGAQVHFVLMIILLCRFITNATEGNKNNFGRVAGLHGSVLRVAV
jgi:hypothetical protein